MSQSTQLLSALKAQLKARGKTYAEVARHLGLSEASVKRLFNGQGFSLQRFEQVCALAGVEISELVQQIDDERRKPLLSLSLEQEQQLCADLELLLVTVCVLNRWTLKEILQHYQFSESQCIRHLATLDRLGLIELQPGNRIRVMTAPNFRWQQNGPIQRFFLEKIEAEFFRSRFDKQNEKLLVATAMLSPPSNQLIQRKMEQLTRELEELNRADSQLPLQQRQGTTLVLAMRQWRFGVFGTYRKS